MSGSDTRFDTHRHAQEQRWAQTTPKQRLMWLHQMKVFVHAIQSREEKNQDEPPLAVGSTEDLSQQ